jgi:putative tryptophan/tyrosine transport system substrate-binding protein
MTYMQRRDFVTLLGVAVWTCSCGRRDFIVGLASAAWPRVARAQQADRTRRVGVLMFGDDNDPAAKRWLSGFTEALAQLGWADGRNLRMDVRWADGNVDRARFLAKELVILQPDAILSTATLTTAALQRETRTVPIIFVLVADPVGAGFVASLPRPSGNITGFGYAEAEMAGKWLELLSEIAPGVKRVAFIFNPNVAPGGTYYLPLFEAAARSFKVEPIPAPVHGDAEIETVIAALGREPGGGFVALADPFIEVRRAPIILLAARYNVPAVYGNSAWVRDGGLLSYAPDPADLFRRAAPYVDRILRGAKPADLPVQLPVKFEMAFNAKTAKALGLTVPPSILLRADEVIE